MITLGLTGSIAAGKSTAAGLFGGLGVPVHDADAAARAAGRLLPGAFPKGRYPALYRDGALDRKALARLAFSDPGEGARLEALIHPEVVASEGRFVKRHRANGAEIAVLDIPLLFETGAQTRLDATLVLATPPEIRRARALARPGMDAALFAAIDARQMPQDQKCARADFVVRSDAGETALERDLRAVLASLNINL